MFSALLNVLGKINCFFFKEIILGFGDIITLEVAGFFPLQFEENVQSIGKIGYTSFLEMCLFL